MWSEIQLEPQPTEMRIAEPRTAISGSREDARASLRILQTTTEFEELRDTWAAWNDGPESDLDLFALRMRHTPGAVRPHVMVVSRNGRPDCILIGWLDQGKVAFKVGSIALFRSDARILRFVNGGFLGNQSLENGRFLLGEIIRSLHKREAQAAEFSQLRADSPLYGLVKREPRVFCRDHFTPLQTHRYQTLPASFDEYLNGLAPKHRMEFRRRVRILERDFPGMARFESVRDPRDVEEFACKADEISRKTHKHALGAGFVNNLETQETLRAAAQKGGLRACLLYLGGRPIAFAMAILCNKTLHGTLTGYDPGYKRYGAGLQCMIRLMQESFEASGEILRFDAGCGDSSYKREIFGSSWQEAPVWIFAPSAKGLSLNVRKVISTALHSLAMRSLEKSGRLRKIKKVWHRRAQQNFNEGDSRQKPC